MADQQLFAEGYTLCNNAAFTHFVSTIGRANSNWFEFARLIAATKFCRHDNNFHQNSPCNTRRFVAATCRRCVQTLSLQTYVHCNPNQIHWYKDLSKASFKDCLNHTSVTVVFCDKRSNQTGFCCNLLLRSKKKLEIYEYFCTIFKLRFQMTFEASNSCLGRQVMTASVKGLQFF